MATVEVIPFDKPITSKEQYDEQSCCSPAEDYLNAMMAKQAELMSVIEADKVDLEYAAFVEEIVHCITNEASEMSAHFLVKTKPWKRGENIVINTAELFEESIDVLHFLLEFWLLMGIDAEEVYDEYVSKNLKNQQRVAAKMAKVK